MATKVKKVVKKAVAIKNPTKAFALKNFKTGDTFKGRIASHDCTGIIHNNGRNVWYCTSNSSLNGECAPNKHGRRYSWVHDTAVFSITITKKATTDKKSVKKSGSIKTATKKKVVRKAEAIRAGDIVMVTKATYNRAISATHLKGALFKVHSAHGTYLQIAVSSGSGVVLSTISKSMVTKVKSKLYAEEATGRLPMWLNPTTLRVGCNKFDHSDIIGFVKVMNSLVMQNRYNHENILTTHKAGVTALALRPEKS